MDVHSEFRTPFDSHFVMDCSIATAVESRPLVKSLPKSIARVYSQVNVSMPQEHWDYDALKLSWGNQDRYEINAQIGKGKYSLVFSGIETTSGHLVAIKVLKPVSIKKVKREIKILLALYGGPNIIKLIDIVWVQEFEAPALIFEYIQNDNFRKLYPRLTDNDIRFYLFELLKALKYCHSCGIMHRDIKPQNIIIDHSARSLSLIDWGLAEFYHPGVQYDCHVASRFHKGPELLVDFQEYDYSLDMWAFGCVMAEMVFEMEVLFRGADNADQLIKIIQVLGYEDFVTYIQKYQIDLPNEVQKRLVESSFRFPSHPFEKFIKNCEKANKIALDLIKRLLRFDHQERLTAEEAMQHPYFDLVRS